MFAFFFCVEAVLLAVAMVFFVKAFYNNAYYFLPDSKQTAEYKALPSDPEEVSMANDNKPPAPSGAARRSYREGQRRTEEDEVALRRRPLKVTIRRSGGSVSSPATRDVAHHSRQPRSSGK